VDVIHRGGDPGVPQCGLDRDQVHAGQVKLRGEGYLYSILKSAWSGVVSVSESREGRG